MTFSPLKMCCWNVGGLISKGVNKTSDPLFIKSVEKYNIAFLVETHQGYNSLFGYIGTFHYHPICRPVTKYNNSTAGNRPKQNSWFCKEIREDNFRFWWRRVHEDASQGMYMSKIEIFFFYCSNIAKSENAMLWRMLSRLETCIVYSCI